MDIRPQMRRDPNQRVQPAVRINLLKRGKGGSGTIWIKFEAIIGKYDTDFIIALFLPDRD
jgi:hypothetical protein